MSVLSGPPQAFIAYSGFILVPLGHGTTIQPACAALFGLILATVVLRERLTAHARDRRRRDHRRPDGVRRRIARHHRPARASAATCCSSPPACSGRRSASLLRLLAHAGHARDRGGRPCCRSSSTRRFMCSSSASTSMLRRSVAENLLQIVVQGMLGRRAADLSVRARGDPARRRTRGDVSGAGAGLRAHHRLSLRSAWCRAWPQLIGLVIVLVGFRFTLR